MSLAELDKMSGEPPLAKWQFVLDASSGATLRSLSAMVCRVLLTPDIVKHSEVRCDWASCKRGVNCEKLKGAI